MAWERLKVEEQRLRLVLAYINREASMVALCNQYNISRKTGHKWVERYHRCGSQGLRDLSRAPHNPNVFYNKQTIDRAIDLKLKRPTWGPKKIAWKLAEMFPEEEWPSPTHLYNVFKEHHLVTSRRLRRRVPATDPLGDLTGCNDTWAVDLKGWFRTGDGYRCEPITITDCYSRYLIRCHHLPKHSVEYVWPVFQEAFREYGLPNRIRSDNGPPFGCAGVGRLTRLSVNLIKAGVTPEWIRPGHPEENGRHERFHLTLKQEVATPPKATLALQIQAMSQFCDEYNFERPHEGLNMQLPANCYRPSTRAWDGILRSPEYDRRHMDVRKVGVAGYISVRKVEHSIGRVLTGEYVGLKTNEDEQVEVYYGPVYLGTLKQTKGLERPKMAGRRLG